MRPAVNAKPLLYPGNSSIYASCRSAGSRQLEALPPDHGARASCTIPENFSHLTGVYDKLKRVRTSPVSMPASLPKLVPVRISYRPRDSTYRASLDSVWTEIRFATREPRSHGWAPASSSNTADRTDNRVIYRYAVLLSSLTSRPLEAPIPYRHRPLAA